MTNKTKELVAAGHALAKELHCAESAALVRELATQLDLQRARADTLAANNENAMAVLKKANQAVLRAKAQLDATPDYYVVVTSVGVWQSFCKTRAEAEFIVAKPFNPGYSVLEIYTTPPAPIAMKDHQIRELVNELRDIAVEYHGTQQLREHIARTIRTALLHGGTLIDEDTTKQTWINCSDRMPEAYESVIFWVVDNIPNDVLEGAYNGYWDGDNWRQCTALTDYGVIDCDLGFIYRCIEPGNKKDPSILRHGSVVSHWMPLPAAPQQGE